MTKLLDRGWGVDGDNSPCRWRFRVCNVVYRVDSVPYCGNSVWGGNEVESVADAFGVPMHPSPLGETTGLAAVLTSVIAPEIDGLRIVAHAGSGGLGDVFVAERSSTGGKVAVKVLRDVDNPADLTRRVRRELDAMLALKGHPGVVQIEDVITTDCGPALVMEFVPGGSLHDSIKKIGAHSAAAVVEVGLQVSTLLSDSHHLGIIHRDIKPHNILKTSFDTYKVCDFGIAALNHRDGSKEHTSYISQSYASPEELDGSTITGASDVYSLGLTLLHLRNGDKQGLRTSAALAFESQSEIDSSLAAVVREMVNVDPRDRPSAATVAAKLKAVLSGDGLVPAEASPSLSTRPSSLPQRNASSNDFKRVDPPLSAITGDPSRRLPGMTTGDSWWDDNDD